MVSCESHSGDANVVSTVFGYADAALTAGQEIPETGLRSVSYN